MNRRLVEVFCSGLLVMLVSMATSNAVMAEYSQKHEQLSFANTQFALDLYKHQPPQNNVFMSPLSGSVALAMTYLGARGETKSQMTQVLHFTGIRDAQLHQAFGLILSALNKPQHKYSLHMANSLFADTSYTILRQFLDVTREHYGAELAPIDFRTDSSGAVVVINRWVAEKTNNKITDLLSPDNVNAQTKLILVNAVYFRGSWKYKFDAANTKDSYFHVSPNEAVKVKMMAAKSMYYYGRSSELHCQAIELLYAGESLSMFILLPELATTSLSELEQNLTADDLANTREIFSMSLQEVSLWLPRFSMDKDMDMHVVLARMGMKDLFMQGMADLSGIDGSKELHVAAVLHRAVVEVNEEGTEAAAATGAVLTVRRLGGPKFRADHPFIFFIQDKTTESVLFVGRLVKPTGVKPSLAMRTATMAENLQELEQRSFSNTQFALDLYKHQTSQNNTFVSPALSAYEQYKNNTEEIVKAKTGLTADQLLRPTDVKPPGVEKLTEEIEKAYLPPSYKRYKNNTGEIVKGFERITAAVSAGGKVCVGVFKLQALFQWLVAVVCSNVVDQMNFI